MMRAYGSPFQLGVPPVVKNLLIINGLFFLAKMSLGQEEPLFFSNVAYPQYKLDRLFSLHWFTSPHFQPWQVITHMFMHADIGHLLSNMFGLFMFGSSLEFLWGGRRFLFYYLVCGLGAASLHLAVEWNGLHRAEETAALYHVERMDVIDANLIAHIDANSVEDELRQAAKDDPDAFMAAVDLFQHYQSRMLGASGAIFGILLAFGMMFPNEIVFMGFFLPLPAKYLVILYGALELWQGVSGASDGVAHFAHLGGMLVGIFLILHWKKKVIL